MLQGSSQPTAHHGKWQAIRIATGGIKGIKGNICDIQISNFMPSLKPQGDYFRADLCESQVGTSVSRACHTGPQLHLCLQKIASCY